MADTSGGKDNRTVNRLGKTERIGRSGEQRAIARMRRCLILRQGASPLKPPAPFPALPLLGREETCQGSASPAKTRPPLTASLPSEETHSNGQGKGPLAMTFRAPPLGRRARRHKASGPPSREFFRLTEAGLLMEAATAKRGSGAFPRRERQKHRSLAVAAQYSTPCTARAHPEIPGRRPMPPPPRRFPIRHPRRAP